MTAERFADDYEPRWDIDSRDGRQSEMWVKSIREALANGDVEVKTDFKYAETGNIYVEHECLRRGKWVPSGIDVTESGVWVFVLAQEECAYTISTDLLRHVSRRMRQHAGNIRNQPRGSHPTRGVAPKLSHLLNEVRDREMKRRQAARRRSA